MKTLGFGQKVGQIVQTAYVVQDVHAAIEWWLHDGKVGPWFLLDSFTGPSSVIVAIQQRRTWPLPWRLPGT